MAQLHDASHYFTMLISKVVEEKANTIIINCNEAEHMGPQCANTRYLLIEIYMPFLCSYTCYIGPLQWLGPTGPLRK